MSNLRISDSINRALIYCIFLLISFFVIYPLIYVVSGAFASLNIIPFAGGFTLQHFIDLFTKTDYGRWFLNTLIIALETSAATVVLSSLSAYVFSRFNFRFKKSFLLSLLVLQIFPSFVGMIAIYVILLRVGGLDTLWGLVLVYTAGNIPYNAWLVKNYMDTVSKSKVSQFNSFYR